MSVTVTQQLTQQTVSVTGNPVENNVVVTVSNARGPEGPEGPSGASTWDDIGGTASSIPFEPVTPPAYAEGLVFYDTDDKSLTYYNDEADVSMNLGREMWVRVRNDSGATIANGKVVYINDAQGQLPTIRLARADAEATSRVIGIATHDIENNSNGYVTTSGMVKGLNTSAFQDGDLLFLSAATAGEMTTTTPTAPNRAVQVAIVAHAHVSQGKLYCHPENDSVASTGIVDSTATGRAILTSATPAAARETALNEIIKYDANAAAARTNPTTQAADDVLTGMNLTAGIWEISFYFSFDSGTCGVQPSFLFGTTASVGIATNNLALGPYYRGGNVVAGIPYATATGIMSMVASLAASQTDFQYVGTFMIPLTGNTTFGMRYAVASSVAGQTVTRRANAFLRARKVNG